MNNILRIGLILVAGYFLYYFITSVMNTDEETVKNDGTMTVSMDSDTDSEDELAISANGNVSANGNGNGRVSGNGNGRGMATTSPMAAQFGAELAQSTPAISPRGSCPPIAQVGSPKMTLNAQIDNIQPDPTCDYQMMKNNVNVLPYPQVSNNYAPQADVNQQFATVYDHQQVKLDCFPKDQLTAEDLLPREDGYNTWQEVNPQAQGHLTDQNFLESGHHFGINTVGQSLKNANKQLRSDPVIPQVPVGPWQQSTYEPDTNRRFFEIGQC